MGASTSRPMLPPAEAVTDGPYDLRSMDVPRLAGPAIRAVAWLSEQAWAGPLLAKSWRDSGVPAAMRGVSLPDPPAFTPLWPARDVVQDPYPNAGAGCGLVSMVGLDPCARAVAGAAAAPAAAGPAAPPPPQRPRSIADYAAAYTAGTVTPSAVADAALAAIEEADAATPRAAWFISVNAADVRRAAAESTARYAARAPLSPLDGVPYAVIDAVDALGHATTAGTAFLAATRPVDGDAPCVAALRAAGAVLLGKANCHEAGVGMTGLNPHWGTPRNPHDPSRHAGGSSSGSAAAVAAGVAAFALGLDGGGSIRVPAALCGVAALRPTVGRTARAGLPPTAYTIAAVGVAAPTVGDAAAVAAVICNAGCDGAVPPPPPLALPARRPAAVVGRPLAGVRVGVYPPWNADAAPRVVAAVAAAADAAVAAGATLVAIAMPELELARCAQIVTIAAELAHAYAPALAHAPTRRRLAPETRVSLAMASRLAATDFLQAAQVRARLMTHFRRAFAACDVVLAPACGGVAPVIAADALAHGETDLRTTGELMRFTVPVNMAGLPAVVVPAGVAEGGMPAGVQIISRPWDEATAVAVGGAIEAALPPGAVRRAALAVDLLDRARTSGGSTKRV